MNAANIMQALAGAGFTIRADAGELVIAGAVKMTDALREQVRANKPELLRLLQGQAIGRGNGQVQGQAIEPGNGQAIERGNGQAHADTTGQAHAAPLLPDHARAIIKHARQQLGADAADDADANAARPFRLTPAEAAAAHAEPWGDAIIARFNSRANAFALTGLTADDADALAERCHLADLLRLPLLPVAAAAPLLPQIEIAARTCRACRQRARPGTCKEPAAAGLADAFAIITPPAGHARRCPAFQPIERTPRT